MLPQSPVEFALWGGLLVGGWVLGYFGSTFEGKWRRRFNEERRFYAQYRDETDRLNIEKTRRIAELEAQKKALSQEVVRLRGEMVTAAPPVVEPAAAPLTATEAPHIVASAPADHANKIDPKPQAEAPPTAAPAPGGVATTPVATPAPEPVASETPATPPGGDPLPIAAATAMSAAAAAATVSDIVPQIETGDSAPGMIPIAADNLMPAADQAPQAIGSDRPVPLDGGLAGLTRIRGIDQTLAAGLVSLGVRQIEDIERLSAEDEKSIEIQLNLSPGQIANQQWRLQAALIGSGEDGLIEPQFVVAGDD
jgi:predicted flap endonuclease-1-like 5' DNA nuclease